MLKKGQLAIAYRVTCQRQQLWGPIEIMVDPALLLLISVLRLHIISLENLHHLF